MSDDHEAGRLKRGAKRSGALVEIDRRRLAREVVRENVRWEMAVMRTLAVLIALAVGMILAISPWIGFDLALPQIVLSIVAIAYFALWALLLERGTAALLPWTRWINTTMETSFATAAIAIGLAYKGPVWATTTATILIYTLAIAATSFRLRPELSIHATVMAVAQWLILYSFFIRPRIPAETLAAMPTLQAWAAWEKAFWIALVGGVVTLASVQARRTATFGRLQDWQRRWLQREFGRFVSRDVVDAVIRGKVGFGRAEHRNVTVLFCDMRDFTALCARESADDMLALLNGFYERACMIIQRRGGYVNKFLGDGVLAIFGAPDRLERHVEAAAWAARELVAAVDEMGRLGGVHAKLRVGIGLDTGEVVTGTVGAPDRLEYTAIGQPVNRAARLQALSSTAAARIILSRACAEVLAGRPDLRELSVMHIKGFDAPEMIYALRENVPVPPRAQTEDDAEPTQSFIGTTVASTPT
jgi:class 3 adenylate cyclase